MSAPTQPEPSADVPAMTPIDQTHARLAWMVVRGKLDAATNLQWQNSLDVLDLFFGFDPRSRRPIR